ncbi:MAG: hypothetical protein BWY77_01217 [bacterium ADurb.Bin431]|nr:MAG: hypothetical protein BWY77_01217 [bacterium ADurb.Bin431]
MFLCGPAQGGGVLFGMENALGLVGDFKAVYAHGDIVGEGAGVALGGEPVGEKDGAPLAMGGVDRRLVGIVLAIKVAGQAEEEDVVAAGVFLAGDEEGFRGQHTRPLCLHQFKAGAVVVVLGEEKGVKAVALVPVHQAQRRDEAVVAVIGVAVQVDEDHVFLLMLNGAAWEGGEEEDEQHGSQEDKSDRQPGQTRAQSPAGCRAVPSGLNNREQEGGGHEPEEDPEHELEGIIGPAEKEEGAEKGFEEDAPGREMDGVAGGRLLEEDILDPGVLRQPQGGGEERQQDQQTPLQAAESGGHRPAPQSSRGGLK